MSGNSHSSLYIHIPFCKRKCDYCHFYVIPDNPTHQEMLYQALLKEWDHYQSQFFDTELVSIYFGGGTPALFAPSKIESLITHILKNQKHSQNIEITIEANPENISLSTLLAFKNAGINRLSIGIQSDDDTHLIQLGRQHNANKAIQAVEYAIQAGFHNLSVDLMYDLPDQTLERWEKTIDRVVGLPITHLSLYNLTIEPYTVFYKYREKLEKRLPNEEASLAMYQYARSKLQSSGFKQYEISAFCKPGYQAIHNSGYWIGRQFIGLGPSAYSYWDKKRFQNIAHFHQYCRALNENRSPVNFEEKLEYEAHLRELLAIRLRLLEGVKLNELQDISVYQKDLDKLIDLGLISKEKNKIFLTEQGILLYEEVATLII